MTGLLSRLLGRLPLGWLQLMHNKTRLIAAVGGVTFANTLIFMQLGFMNALFETSVMTHRRFDAHVVLTGTDFRTLREATPLPRTRMLQMLDVDGVAAASPVYLGTAVWTDPERSDTTNFRFVGVDPDARVFVDPLMQRQLDRLKEPDSALVDIRTRDLNPRLAERLRRGERPRIEIAGRRLTLVGCFEQGASFDVDGSILVSDQTFLRLFPQRRPGTPTLVIAQCEDPEASVRVADAIDRYLPESDVRAFSMAGFVAAEQAYQAEQSPIGFVFGFGVIMGMVVGLVIVYQVLATDVQDHLSEYATFKAIGYGPRFFLGIVFEEALSLATLGFLPGFAIALVLYQVASNATALPITMPLGRPFFVFGLTVVMCTLSGFIATRRLNAADPADLF